MPPLKIATATYGLTRPLKQGDVRCATPLEFVEVNQITTDGMRPMVRSLAFDVCEMAFTTYLCARAMGKPLTAIPLFVTRNFHQWAAFYNVKSGIKGPKDLEGRRVGVNRGYTVTTGLWNRGILKHEYGVDLDKVTWCPTDEEHVSEFEAPANVDYRFMGRSCADLLASGELDAAVGDIPITSPDVRPLIRNAREAGYAWYAKTGVFPVNHGLVVKNSVLQSEPHVAVHLFEAFSAAKKIYLDRLRAQAGGDEADELARSLSPVVGGDPFPFGVAANRPALETIIAYAV
ncbi:MAG TPA: ABC transporter substrate-binding protein, partial [Stellaceae bacterium]|nr:ABC transporter substrate-binding protein [Stellaceae bacterium]